MDFPARITAFYEVHYVLSGLKQVVVVEKANMSELDAWLCTILFVTHGLADPDIGAIQALDEAKVIAHQAAISHVRWNKLSKFDRRRPSVFVYGDVLANGIFLQPKIGQEEL